MGESFELARLLVGLEAEMGKPEDVSNEPLPASLPLASITTLPKLFQVRDAVDAGHVGDIARALREGASVPPLLVLRTGHRAIVLDGHHRLEAYHRAGIADAPVVAFQGTVAQAVLEASAANAITKLPMTPSERADAAWRYVRLGKHSKADIVKATGCSDGRVANMRRVLKRLDDAAHNANTWAEAMRLDRMNSREGQTDAEQEEWMEATAQRYADTMAKALGGKLTANPEIAARTLAIHFGRRLEEVARHLEDWLPDRDDIEY